MRALLGFVLLLAVASTPSLADARPGVLDPSFGKAGTVISDSGPGRGAVALGVAVQSDGKIIAAGTKLVRYLPDGRVDESYGIGGAAPLALAPGFPRPVIVAGDDLLVGEGSDGTVSVARYRSDGTLDPSFGTDGVMTTSLLYSLRALAVQPDGKILLAGGLDLSVLRLDTDGTVDGTFGNGGVATNEPAAGQTSGATALALQPDGAIVVGSEVSTPGGTNDFLLTRFDPTGQVDPSFGNGGLVVTDPLGGGDDTLTDLLVQPDGVVAVGRTIKDIEYWFVLVRYVDGVVDPLFGVLGVTQANFRAQSGGNSEFPYAATTDADGNLLVIGSVFLHRATGVYPFAMMRFEPNGTLDAAFGTGGGVLTEFPTRATSYAAAVAPDGRIVLAGEVRDGDDRNIALARYAGGGADLPRCPHTREHGCAELPADGKARFAIKNGTRDKSDVLAWQWAAPIGSDFGDPATTDAYALCVYTEADDLWPPLRYAAAVQPGGTCRGKPCWKARSAGFKYATNTDAPMGVTSLALKQSGGTTKIALKGRGANLGGVNLLPISLPVVVQLQAGNGRCWSSTFAAPALRNDHTQLKARADP